MALVGFIATLPESLYLFLAEFVCPPLSRYLTLPIPLAALALGRRPGEGKT